MASENNRQKVLDEAEIDKNTIHRVKTLWKELNYSLGISLIDLQHIWLFYLTVELEKLGDSNEDQITRQKKLKLIIFDLESYISEHFYVEESLLHEFNYTETSSHIKQHLNFNKELKSFLENPSLNKTQFAKLIKFLKFWLIQHIHKEDRKYSEYFIIKDEDPNRYLNWLISENKVTVLRAQSALYAEITDSNEIDEIVSNNIIENIIKIWNTHNLSVGFHLFDLQHIWLIYHIVELEIAIRNRQHSSIGKLLSSTISSLREYTEQHIEIEEEVLKKFGYRDSHIHAEKHKSFHKIIENNHKDYLDPETPKRLLIDLKSWLFTHIAIEDQKYVSALQEKKSDIDYFLRGLVSKKQVLIPEFHLDIYNSVIGLSVFRL